MTRLGKRERREARKASGFDLRKAMVAANLSSPVARTYDRGLINTAQASVLGSKSPRASVAPSTGTKDTSPKAFVVQRKLNERMRHKFTIADQFGDTWGGCDREKDAYAMRDSLQRWPDHAKKGRVFKVVDNR